MGWRQFVLQLGSLDAGAVEDVFVRNGALAVTLRDAADDPVLEPMPGETPLWRETSVTGLFDESFDAAALVDDLGREFGPDRLSTYATEVLEDRAWEREWLKDFRPTRFGNRLWVSPVDAEVPEGAEAIIRLDPGLAFGTGTHPTTALCLEKIDGLDVSGKRVLDFGCGSGILALGTLLLGAESAMAYDIDQQAIIASRSNAAQNGVLERLHATTDRSAIGGNYDLVLANILSGPLIDLADDILSRLAAGGTLVLSGILQGQADSVRNRYHMNVEFGKPSVRDDWVCLSGMKRVA